MNTREQIRQAATSPAKTTVAPKVPAPAPANDVAKVAATPKAPKAPKAAKVATECKCNVPDVKGTNGGCNGGKTKGVFAPGHDAKLTGYLTREVVAGNMTKEEAVADLAGKGGSTLLQGKLVAAIDREVTKATKKAQAEATKAQAKAEKEATLAEARRQGDLAKQELAAKNG